MLNKSNVIKLLLLVAVLSLTLLARNYATLSVQAIGGDDPSIYLPIAIKPEPTPTVTPTPTPMPTPTPDPTQNFDRIINVASSGSDSGNCGAENAPCASIQQAVDAALASQVNEVLIKVAQGTYTGSGKAVVSLISDQGNPTALTIRGGYTSSNWNSTTLNPDDTIIDGQNARRGMFIRNLFNKLTIQGITIQNGLLNDGILIDDLDSYAGAGLYCINSTMTLASTTIKNSTIQRTGVGAEPVSGGGAAFYRDCPVTMQNVVFDSNVVKAGNSPDNNRGGQALGGGFHATTGSHVNATNLTLTNNQAIGGSGGAGVDARGERPDGLGGGAALQVNNVVMDGIIVTGNEAIAGTGKTFGGYGDGGGLFFEVSTGEVRNGLLRDNLATSRGDLSPETGGTSGGGAIMGTESTLTLERLIMVHNSAIGGDGTNFSGHALGGALYVDKLGQHPMVVTGSNLIIADNTCEAGQGQNRWGGGGGIHTANTQLTLSHITMANNTVLDTMLGPAIEVVSSSSSVANIDYSIIANHADTTLPAVIVALEGSEANLNHTLWFNNSGGDTANPFGNGVINSTNEMSGDPEFVNPGSPDFDYHIGPNSAARDQASGSQITIDIDNQARDGSPDIGADEYMP